MIRWIVLGSNAEMDAWMDGWRMKSYFGQEEPDPDVAATVGLDEEAARGNFRIVPQVGFALKGE